MIFSYFLNILLILLHVNSSSRSLINTFLDESTLIKRESGRGIIIIFHTRRISRSTSNRRTNCIINK